MRRSWVAIGIVLVMAAVAFLSQQRSSYSHSAIWGSCGYMKCQCYGFEYAANPGLVDAPTWTNCIGYIDRSACDCQAASAGNFYGSCDFENIVIECSQETECSLNCGNYTYSTCPEGCIQRCIPSVCTADGICTQDCDGKGSCSCPA